MGDMDLRFDDATKNHGSRSAVSVDVSSVVTKAVAEALASLISIIISDTMKNSGFDMVLAHHNNLDARVSIVVSNERNHSPDHHSLMPRVSAGVYDASNEVSGGALDSRVLAEDSEASKEVYGGIPGARVSKTLDGHLRSAVGNPVAMGIRESDHNIASDSTHRIEN
ncbi:hypothetical protein NE237_013018 [Protea cynaroides]|uniref:Uncharacterized protein n=1 Tax=Protea cynaroides TaxID=273540 RepID=A0A9Q0GZ57_9MAGN|nr:hypothetical protein NE237_013018 [Protea cynaroides]